MFKTNLSPLNPVKDKYSNNNFIQQTNDMQSHHQSTYQYQKGLYTGINNNQYKQDIGTPGGTYSNAPLSPLSPNINKNPMSPTAKMKMFSNTLTLNKKVSNGQAGYQNTQPGYPSTQHQTSLKQNKMISKLVLKNFNRDLTQSIDLKCDQVLQQSDFTKIGNKRYQQEILTPKQNTYPKKQKLSIPVLNFQTEEIDDLKCDQVLDINKTQINENTKGQNNDKKLERNRIEANHDESRRNIKYGTNLIHNHGVNDIQNNFGYPNQAGIANVERQKRQGPLTPLTPNYQRKKANPLLIMKKNTDRDIPVSSNGNYSQHAPHQQKSRSFTNILSPHPQSNKHRPQQNNEQQSLSQPQNISIQSNRSSQQNFKDKSIEQMRILLQRTAMLLDTYKQKLQQSEEKNVFLEKENVQLRKCLYDDNSGGKNREGNFVNIGNNSNVGSNYQRYHQNK